MTVFVKRALVPILLAMLLAACARGPTNDRAMLQQISAEAKVLLATPSEISELPASDLPNLIRSLEPQSVRLMADGVYISLGSFFATEWGYFVPRDASSFDPTVRGDPTFRALGYDVYWYAVKG